MLVSDITKKRLSNIISVSMKQNNINSSLFYNMSDEDWRELFFISKVHAVEAVVYNEILSFDSSLLPSNKTCLKMFSAVEATKKLNNKIYDIVGHLSSIYHSMGIEFIIFKGPVCGINYKDPLLRGVGDIDIYFTNHSDFIKANEWAMSENFVYYIDGIKQGHWSFKYENIIIEHHCDITFFESNKYNIRFKELISKDINSDGLRYIMLRENIEVKTFSVGTTYLYIFLHLFYHFVHGGIGLRQFMDWIYMTNVYGKDIDRDSFASYCKEFEISYPIGLFARVSVDYFDVDPNIFPFDISPSSSDSILLYNDIIECGNFGILHTKYWRGKWLGRFHKWIKTIKRTMKIYHISPQYTKRVPFAMFVNRIYLSLFK